MAKYLLGLDIGSSSVKVAIVDIVSGKAIATASSPASEMSMISLQAGWAEQEPDSWYREVKNAMASIKNQVPDAVNEIAAIGIAYQMHGLVLLDENGNVLRPSIIWCDSRATAIGKEAFDKLGHEYCLNHYLNSPGNFTASKLSWVRQNEPALFQKIKWALLPGDYIAFRLTGQAKTTYSGLSEGILWDFKRKILAHSLLEQYEISPELFPKAEQSFSFQGQLTATAAEELGLNPGIPVTYRAGDQPNNAFSLNVLQPGEVAATAGTSGVVYGIADKLTLDALSRVNSFAHVNHRDEEVRLGILMCINGTGILNAWIKNQAGGQRTYSELNSLAEKISPGSEGLRILPFGNGAERILEDKMTGVVIDGLDLNQHKLDHLVRAAHEGIAFAFYYGMQIMNRMGIATQVIRAGNANMFLSKVFRETLATLSGAKIELFDTDGAIGAARGAGYGAGLYKSFEDCFQTLQKLEEVHPVKSWKSPLMEAYSEWEILLTQKLAGKN